MRKIGKYEIGITLGRGNFSKVKLAYDTEDNSEWALKIIDRALVEQENMERHLKREIFVMSNLKHQNIVQLREVLQTSRCVYLVLELAPGGDLFDRIVEANGFDEDTARTYFRQLISGLCYCHKMGFSHRDLKPENLLLDEAGNLKVTDFGLCGFSEESFDDGKNLLQTTCGTPNYVAPEVLHGKGYRGDMADIWSCGVILYVMLAGCFPFDDRELNALFRKVENGEYQRLRMVSEEASDLIEQMLTVDPQQRITTHGILKHPWFSVGQVARTLEYEVCGNNEITPRGCHSLPSTKVPTIESKVTEFVVGQDVHDKALGNIKDKTTKNRNKNLQAKGDTLSSDAAGKFRASSIVAVCNDVSDSTTETQKFNTDQSREKVEKDDKSENVLPSHTEGTTAPKRNISVSLLHLAHTRFVFDGSMDDLILSLEELEANPEQVQPMKVKGYKIELYGLLTYTATVCRSRTPGFLRVHMHQSCGDVIDFHEFYAQLMMSMKDKLRSDGEW